MSAAIPAIKSADKWRKDTAGELRVKRFAPTAAELTDWINALQRFTPTPEHPRDGR